MKKINFLSFIFLCFNRKEHKDLSPFSLLLFSLLLFSFIPATTLAQLETPFDGTEFKIIRVRQKTGTTPIAHEGVTFQFPFYDETDYLPYNDRFIAKHQNGETWIQYTTNYNAANPAASNWEDVIQLWCTFQTAVADNYNSVYARRATYASGTQPVIKAVKLHSSNQYGYKTNNNDELLVATSPSYGAVHGFLYTNQPPNKKGERKYYAALRWENFFNMSQFQDQVVYFRIRGKIQEEKYGGVTDFFWYCPTPVIVGNPLNKPQSQLSDVTMLTNNETPAKYTGQFQIHAYYNNPAFSILKDRGTSNQGASFPYYNMIQIRFPGAGAYTSEHGTNRYTDYSSAAGGFTFQTPTGIPKAQLNTGFLCQVEATRGDMSVLLDQSSTIDPYYIQYSSKSRAIPLSIPPYPQPKTVKANFSHATGEFTLIWTIDKGTQESLQDGYEIAWKRAEAFVWRYDKINCNVIYNPDATSASFKFDLMELNCGDQNYMFAVKRAGMAWDAVDHFGEKYEAVTDKSIKVNTNPAHIDNVFAEGRIQSAFLTWGLTDGIKNPSWRMKITRNHDNKHDTIPFLQVSYLDTMRPFSTCQPTTYTLEVLDATGVKVPAIPTYTTLPVAWAPDTLNAGTITSISVSKGYYNDRVEVTWTVSPNATFSRYEILRKPIAEGAQEQHVVDILPTSLTKYNYTDMNAYPGIYYTYIVRPWIDCEEYTVSLEEKRTIGFSQPYGVVSGRVVTKQGNALKDVNVMASVDDSTYNDYKNRAYDFNGRSIIETKKDLGLSKESFTLQTWINLQKDYPNIGFPILHNHLYKVRFHWDFAVASHLVLSINYRGVIATFVQHNPAWDEYFHMSITAEIDSIKKPGYTTLNAKLYVNGELVDSAYGEKLSGLTYDANLSNSYIGGYVESEDYYYMGWEYTIYAYFDEFRLWNRVLTANDIRNNYDRYLSGSEIDLALYYRFDELDGVNEVFDISRRNNVFNENHGKAISPGHLFPSPRTLDTPTREQLAIKALTNAQGYYLLNTIPYSGYGNTWAIKPLQGNHTFDPNERNLYFSAASTTHNNIDFTNTSSFKLWGYVMYEGGTYPVEGCFFEIDGMPVLTPQGMITSEDNGFFSIDVPLGTRKVQVRKHGHTFVDNGYFLDQHGKDIYYYEDRQLNMFCTTRVKLIGHVVGGKVENDKISGFGFRNNNIGVDSLVLRASVKVGTELRNSTDSLPQYITFRHDLDPYAKWTPEKRGGLEKDSSSIKIHGNDITIYVSKETGEFVAWVYPELYDIFGSTTPESRFIKFGTQSDDVSEFDDDQQAPNKLDLRNATVMDEILLQKSIITFPDTIFHESTPYSQAWEEPFENADTVRFHEELAIYYQPIPTYTITQWVEENIVDYFGEKTFDLGVKDVPPVQLYNSGEYLLNNKPLFQQGNLYTFKLRAFEHFINPYKVDGEGNVYEETVPIDGGAVRFMGELMYNQYPDDIYLNEDGEGKFTFVGGMADLTTGLNNLSSVVRIGGIPFYSKTEEFGENGLTAYLLGGKNTGTDFLTAAPDKIDFILHDPPGSNSYAYIEQGTSISRYKKTSFSERRDTLNSGNQELGMQTMSMSGFGAMLGGLIETDQNEDAFQISTRTTIANGLTLEKNSFKNRLSTSSSPDFVGHMADVFVGTGTNTLYGLSRCITLISANEHAGTDIVIDSFPRVNPQYKLVKRTGLLLGLSFPTQFYFTTHDIKNIMIPKWKQLLKMQFVFRDVHGTTPVPTDRPIYVSNLPISHPNFGLPNYHSNFGVDTVYGDNGPSYTRIFPQWMIEQIEKGQNPVFDENDDCPTCPVVTVNMTDSVVYYYENIKKWENLLRFHEKRKVDAINKGYYLSGNNISFGGGATIEKSQTYESVKEWENTQVIETFIQKYEETGASYFGFGYTVESAIDITTLDTSSEGEIQTGTTTVGFVLDENGLTDQLTVDWCYNDKEVDVGTYMFRTRGGRTSCPYEGGTVTEYYEPGQHQLDEATMQIEVPVLVSTSGYVVINVPESKPAVFNLHLRNESETDGTGWFILTVAEETNPHGAILAIDGMPIANGRYFWVTSGVGAGVQKTLTVNKGPVQEKYHGIKLYLSSVCDPALRDSIIIDVEFIPSCTDIKFKYPYDNWVLNIDSRGEIDVELTDFNINFNNFAYIELQSRRISDYTWSTDQYFYYDPAREATSQNPSFTTLLNPAIHPTVKYPWKKDAKPDGLWEIRARTQCETLQGYGKVDFITVPVSGIMDTRAPQSMGISPSNGILAAGDEISITFNEDIQVGLLSDHNFKITGVLNEQELGIPDVGLSFSGTEHAKTSMPIYTNGSFSIETEFLWEPGTSGTLFAYGSGDNFLSLGINNIGQAVVRIGNDPPILSKTSVLGDPITIDPDRTWKYIAMSYDRNTNQVNVYKFESGEGMNVYKMMEMQPLVSKPEMQGILIVGNDHNYNNIGNTNGFVGNVARLHFYATKHYLEDIAGVFYQAKSGREPFLVGYWQLNEGEGNMGKDKARSRHLSIPQNNWFIHPEGRGKETEEGKNIAIITSTYPMSIYHSFTFEFWFRSQGNDWQEGQTIFSADYGFINVNSTGGLDFFTRQLDSAAVFLRTLTEDDMMTGEWHHLAMSVRRGGNTAIYIDGVNVAVFPDTQLGNFGSAYFDFGAKRTRSSTDPHGTHTDYLTGYFDEIRVWNSTLTKDMILANKGTKLRGDEAGLYAYYPFEKYNRLSTGYIYVEPTNQNMAELQYAGDTVLMALGAANFSNVAVAMKDAPPVENVPFSFVASSNKIVLNIDPYYFARVEGVILDISAKNVFDLRGNRGSAENWTAFVRRNALRWDTDPINIVMQEGEQKTFTARIINTGGLTVNYVFDELPGYITGNANAGSLMPLAHRDFTFTIDQGINIGFYETAIGITSGNGVMEYLPLQIKVTGERPDWEVNPHDFETSMNIIGQVKIDGVLQNDSEDLLAAFIGDLCVGLTSPIEINNAGYVFLTVYGNAPHNNQPLAFKYWQASTGRIFPQVIPENLPPQILNNEIRFAPTQIVGSYQTPVQFKALDVVAQTIDLKTGWNWISVNVLKTDDTPTILNQMKTSLMDVGEIIKGQTAYIQQPYWLGNLTAISPQQTYYVKVTDNYKMILLGAQGAPNEIPITINPGWNWIGYLPWFNTPITYALAGLEGQAAVGDLIKDQLSFATYIGYGEWVGNLTYMQPGKGYLYHSNRSTPMAFHYPNETMRGGFMIEEEVLPYFPQWSVDANRFSGNMTIMAVMVFNKKEIRNGLIEVAAFCEEQCRGTGHFRYNSTLERYIGFLTIYGNANDVITFKVLNHETGREYRANNEPILFATDAMLGSHTTPYIIRIGSDGLTTDRDSETAIFDMDDEDMAFENPFEPGFNGESGITENNLSEQVFIYPNPTSTKLHIDRPWKKLDKIEVIDVYGRIILQYENFTGASIDVLNIAQGLYFLKITNKEEQTIVKFVKE